MNGILTIKNAIKRKQLKTITKIGNNDRNNRKNIENSTKKQSMLKRKYPTYVNVEFHTQIIIKQDICKHNDKDIKITYTHYKINNTNST